MRKILILFCLFIGLNMNEVSAYNIICPSETINIQEEETFFNKISGLNFASKQIAQAIIQKEINDELDSKIVAELEIFSIKQLKKGEFKSLSLKSDNLKYRALSLTDFYAQSICPFNKVVYTNKRIYFQHDIPFKYKAKITNTDIQNIIQSKEFQNELKRSSIKINGVKVFEFKQPIVEIKNNKLFFQIPVKTMFGSVKIKFYTDIEVQNDKIVLKNITFSSKSNIISDSMLEPVLTTINPISYETKSLNGKFCNIHITEAKISDNIIYINGIFIINKNYGK